MLLQASPGEMTVAGPRGLVAVMRSAQTGCILQAGPLDLLTRWLQGPMLRLFQ